MYNPASFKNNFSAFGQAGANIGNAISGIPNEKRAESAEARRSAAEDFRTKTRPLDLERKTMMNRGLGLSNAARDMSNKSKAIDLGAKEFADTSATDEDYLDTTHLVDTMLNVIEEFNQKNEKYSPEEMRALELSFNKYTTSLKDRFKTKKDLLGATDSILKNVQGMVAKPEVETDSDNVKNELIKAKIGTERARQRKLNRNDNGKKEKPLDKYSKAVVAKDKERTALETKLNTYKKALGSAGDKETKIQVGEESFSRGALEDIINNLESKRESIGNEITLIAEKAKKVNGSPIDYVRGYGFETMDNNTTDDKPPVVKKKTLLFKGVPVDEAIQQAKNRYKDRPDDLEYIIQQINAQAK
jgi:hypothetical protein